MKINIKLHEDRTLECNNNLLGKTLENETTLLHFDLPKEFAEKDFYLEFEKSNGKKVSTGKLLIEQENENYYVDFLVPNAILDIKGNLKMEVVLRNGEEVFKSYSFTFVVLQSIEATEEIIKIPDFVSEVQKVVDLISTDGDGTKYLSDDGTYKLVQGGSSEELDPTVPSYVKEITEEDIEKWNNKSNFSGSYNDLKDLPIIPTSTSQLTNDSNFVDKIYVDEIVGDIETILGGI